MKFQFFYFRNKEKSNRNTQFHRSHTISKKDATQPSNDFHSAKKRKWLDIQNMTICVVLAIVCFLAIFLVLPYDNTQKVNTQQAVASSSPIAGMTIGIDPGHGGFDPGALGSGNIKESTLNLAVSLLLKEELESRGAYVMLSREEETALADDKQSDMYKRSEFFSQEAMDIGISIHMNKFSDSSANGPMVYYYPTSAEGERLAQAIQTALDNALGRSTKRTAQKANYFVLRESPTVSALVECGFLSNSNDLWLLQQESHQLQIVRGIADGLESFVEEERARTPTTPDPTASADPSFSDTKVPASVYASENRLQ